MIIPCKDCLVFPMCKSRLIEHNSVFNPSGLFAYLKGQCSIVRQAYYKTKEGSLYARTVLPYSEQAFCKDVLNHFKLPPNQFRATTL